MNVESGYLLLVEDDPDILKLLNTTLTYSGYRVVTARNGKEGLEAMRKERPAIVITDIMMPKLDGFGLVHRLRLDPETRDIPVVFITATYVTPEDREFAFDVGATHFIQKPLNLGEFLATIDELLKQGMPVTIEPLDEYNFYDGYRRRLETKLEQLNKQIARDKLLLGDKTDASAQALKASFRKSTAERDDITLLLEQIRDRLKKFEKPK
jgi:DNA-binding response OmpR family regulator